MESRFKPGDRVTGHAGYAGTVIDPDTLSKKDLIEAISLHFGEDWAAVRYLSGYTDLTTDSELRKDGDEPPQAAPGYPPPPPWANNS
jgi:hypothetical protein